MLPYLNPQYLSGKSFYRQQEAGLPLSNSAAALSPPTYDIDIDLFAAHFLASDWTGALDTPDLAPQGSKEANAAAAPPAREGGQKKRRLRTDRHSKITTAQGVRDRRMRLSLDVAGKFFALQDMLGFDKASQTVDWLLTQSKPAIKRLINESSNKNNNKTQKNAVSKAAVDPNLSKGLREKARARARERTQEKRRMMSNGIGNGCKIYQMASAEAENTVKEGDCFDGDKNECSPVAVVPSWVVCKNGKVDYFINESMNKGFPGNIEEGEQEGNSFGNMQFQDSSWDDYSMLSF
uniref:Uncharacterized protein n=1 Tax=Ananas comosus var. bracteatus TaxID=296719 RepID=A0A6V7P7Q1_ANACO|nr:unnamed protein product [Ananas comosus var. bracteatus]